MKALNKLRNQKGISVTSLLIITVILLIIGISGLVYIRKMYKKKLSDDIQSNMYTLNSIAVEVQNGKVHNEKELLGKQVSEEKKNDILEKTKLELSQNDLVYEVDKEQLEQYGIHNIDSDKYYIIYNLEEKKSDIIYTEGIEIDNKNIYSFKQMKEEQ